MARSLHAGRETWLQGHAKPNGADALGTGHILCGRWTEHTAAPLRPGPASAASLKYGSLVWPLHLQVPLQEFLRR